MSVGPLQDSSTLWIAVGLIAMAGVAAALIVWAPSKAISVSRRRYGVAPAPTGLTRAAEASTSLVERVLRRRGGGIDGAAHALDLAGVKRTVPEFILLVGSCAIAAGALGFLLGGLVVTVLLAGMTVAASYIFVQFRADMRRDDFADQLDDLVQLLGSNLRAGHSVLQALDSVSRELEEPASTEIARIVNQVRVGRDLGEALEEGAERMISDDFRWIAQAISIHRQVGGNLAEVMDTVGETIRERNQIRRQVRALSAEGRISAYVLGGLPFAIFLLFQIVNPGYVGQLTSRPLGWAMITVALALLAAGGFWLSKLVKIKF